MNGDIREFFLVLGSNRLFISAVIGWVTAQVLKTLIMGLALLNLQFLLYLL